jgi:hypothetical protein
VKYVDWKLTYRHRDYQQRVLEMVLEHHQKEQSEKRQVRPEIETQTGSIIAASA